MELFIFIIFPVVAACVSYFFFKERKYFEFFLVLVVLSQAFFALYAGYRAVLHTSVSLGNNFSYDGLSALFLILISAIGVFASIYSIGYIRHEMKEELIGPGRMRQYYTLLYLFLFSMYLAVLANHPLVTWIAIETTTLSTALLISMYNKPAAMEAAWKYLIINSVGLLVGLFGTVLYLALGAEKLGNDMITWQNLTQGASLFNPEILKIAFIFVLVGYGTKMGLAPMHTWLPDAHGRAPVPISSLLSGVLLNVSLYAILRYKVIGDASFGSAFSQSLFIILGIVSVVVAMFMIIIQTNYKRLLAYSSIENMGIIALGIGFGGVGALAALMHMVYHALAKSFIFLVSGNIFMKYKTTKIKNIKGMFKALPYTTILFISGIFALIGFPPFGNFVSKMYILSAGFKTHPFIAGLLALFLVIIFFGFFRHLQEMIFGEPPENIAVGENGLITFVPLVAMLVLILLLSVFMPSMLRELIFQSYKIIGG